MSEDRRAYWRRKYHERRARLGRRRGAGRPPKLTPPQVEQLLYEVRHHPERPLAAIAATWQVSEATVRRYAHRAGIRRRGFGRPTGGHRRPAPRLPWYEGGLASATMAPGNDTALARR